MKIITPVIIDCYTVNGNSLSYLTSEKLKAESKDKFSKFLQESLAYAQNDFSMRRALDSAYKNLGADITMEEVDGIVALVINTNPLVEISLEEIGGALNKYIESLSDVMLSLDSQQGNNHSYEAKKKFYSPRLIANTLRDKEMTKYGDSFSHTYISEEK